MPELLATSCVRQGHWLVGLSSGHVVGYLGCTPLGPRLMLRDCWYAAGPGLTPGSQCPTVMISTADVLWCAVAERHNADNK